MGSITQYGRQITGETQYNARDIRLRTFKGWQGKVFQFVQHKQEERYRKLLEDGLDDKQAQAEIKSLFHL